jgi:hypothetical protein
MHVTELVRGILNKPATSRPCVTALMLDLSNAFDSVNHELLLSELQHIGLQHPSIKLMHSYLTRRTQSVKLTAAQPQLLSTIYSADRIPTCGVPQGSVLGPILLNVYVNSLCMAIQDPSATVISYADDTTILLLPILLMR